MEETIKDCGFPYVLASSAAPCESRNDKVKIESVKIPNLERIETNKFRSGCDLPDEQIARFS